MFEGQRLFLRTSLMVSCALVLLVSGCSSSAGNSKPTLQFNDTFGQPIPGDGVHADVTTTNDAGAEVDAGDGDLASPKDQPSPADQGPTDSNQVDLSDQGPSKSECEIAGIPDTGSCDGDTLLRCVEGEPELVNCAMDDKTCSITDDGTADCVPKICEPQCDGKSCGEDGCGGQCGICSPGQQCQEHQCVPKSGCQDCSSSELCVEDSCVPNPDCEGFTWEGCCSGDNVIYCQDGAIKEQNCGSNGCGWSDSGSFYNCNGGGEGPPQFPIDCPQECQPNCDGLSCGPDGCGGTCGTCDDNESCQSGQCAPDPIVGCPGIPPTGTCEGTVKVTCEGGVVMTENCALLGKTCWLQLLPLPPSVACKPLSDATCPGFLEDGYCSGNVLITCEGTSLEITDCKAEGSKICAFKAEEDEFGCINPN